MSKQKDQQNVGHGCGSGAVSAAWGDRVAPLLSPGVELALREAIELFSSDAEQTRASLAPLTTALAWSSTLLTDAEALLSGDTDALARFDEAISVLRCPRSGLDDRAMQQLVSSKSSQSVRAKRTPDPTYMTLLLAGIAAAGARQDLALANLVAIAEMLSRVNAVRTLASAGGRAIESESERDRAHFRRIADQMGEFLERDARWPLCGGGPIPQTPERDDPLDIVHRLPDELDCIIDYLGDTTRSRFRYYAVTEITPSGGCGGEEITLRGWGFGSDPHDVVFTTSDGPVRVAATSWSDTEITVVAPQNLVCGRPTLDLPVEQEAVCGRTLLVRAFPFSLVAYDAGAPNIEWFRVRAVPSTSGPRRGDRLEADWRVCPSNAVVSFRLSGPGAASGTTSYDAVGSVELPLPPIAETAPINVTLHAINACGEAEAVRTATVRRPS